MATITTPSPFGQVKLETGADLDKALRFYLDKADSQALPELLGKERELLLNDALKQLTKQLLMDKDESQDTILLRQHLHFRASIPARLSEDQELYVVALPADMVSHSRLQLLVEAGGQQRYSAPNLTTNNRLNSLLGDPFNQSSPLAPLCAFGPGGLLVYRDSTFTVLKARYEYYRRARPISISSTEAVDFPALLLPGIVQLAVSLALETIESPRTQTQAPLTTLTTSPIN